MNTNDMEVLNIKQCTFCGGTVDRSGYLLKCRDCGSVGDLVTGIMNPSYVRVHSSAVGAGYNV